MSHKELRVSVLGRVLPGDLSLKEGARLMVVSYRHARRLKAAFTQSGPSGLCHGNRGRASFLHFSPLCHFDSGVFVAGCRH